MLVVPNLSHRSYQPYFILRCLCSDLELIWRGSGESVELPLSTKSRKQVRGHHYLTPEHPDHTYHSSWWQPHQLVRVIFLLQFPLISWHSLWGGLSWETCSDWFVVLVSDECEERESCCPGQCGIAISVCVCVSNPAETHGGKKWSASLTPPTHSDEANDTCPFADTVRVNPYTTSSPSSSDNLICVQAKKLMACLGFCGNSSSNAEADWNKDKVWWSHCLGRSHTSFNLLCSRLIMHKLLFPSLSLFRYYYYCCFFCCCCCSLCFYVCLVVSIVFMIIFLPSLRHNPSFTISI